MDYIQYFLNQFKAELIKRLDAAGFDYFGAEEFIKCVSQGLYSATRFNDQHQGKTAVIGHPAYLIQYIDTNTLILKTGLSYAQVELGIEAVATVFKREFNHSGRSPTQLSDAFRPKPESYFRVLAGKH